MQLSVKNMVCNRCIKVVHDELTRIGIKPVDVRLGEVLLEKEPSERQLETIRTVLEENGFEILDDRRKKTIERIKRSVIDIIQHGTEEELERIVFSQYIADKVGAEYQQLSSLFSQHEGITIEKYIIAQKIERVKELMVYDELTISQISYRLGYSSVHHLSNQFKKVTGMTPTEFKKLQTKQRLPLDKVGTKK
ncbi:MAG: helix-turn-helix domain-containing protein [Candidatus Kapabacteria bacterium]|nr:helix-turn-helix domain-containing protein [Candidatus Kapabacteria bacterium]MBX7156577.1 helix-turn-helix domain-containing protein [Bacteroidota bacterium]